MDNKPKRYLQPVNIKRFTLNTIATAIIALNTDLANAAPCPSQIVGTALAGVICNFSVNTSVTVNNGGVVGGILMTGYHPAPSHITIDTGGIITNTTATGISITSSTLTNGITNNGTISTTAGSIIISSNSTVGGISNNGTIASASSTTIRVINNNTINGNIINSGTINSEGSNNNGIVIGFGNQVTGDIKNEGIITAGPSGNGIIIFVTNTVNGNISNSGTISAGHSGIAAYVNITINGNISNSGTIIGNFRGIRLANASTLSGNISNSGSVYADANGILVDSQTLVGGSVSNSGTVRANDTGIAVTNTSTVTGGISNSGIIQGNNHAIYVDGNSTVNNINILGQHARVIGTIDATNSDLNIKSGALFTSEGDFNIRRLNIESDGVFNMANTITANDSVNNEGTLAVGNGVRTINSNAYVQNTGGIFQTQIINSTDYGQLIVDNTVDLSQSGNIDVQVTQNSSIHAGEVFTNIISGGTLIAPTNGFNVSDNSFVWQFTANTNNTSGVDLTAAINPTAYNVCRGDFCQGAARVIIGQIAAGNSVFNPYALLTTANAFQIAASKATPELTNENLGVIQTVTKAVMDVAPMWSNLHGKSAGEVMLYPPGKIWLKPYRATLIQGQNNSVDGFKATAYGVVIGEDIQLPQDWLLGGAFAVGANNLHGSATLSGQSIYSSAYQGMLYSAKRFPSNLYVAGQGLVGYGYNHTDRSIPLYTTTAKGTYHSWYTNLRAELGWSFNTCQENLILTPALDASYLYIHQSSYQENGSPMDLSVAASRISSLIIGAYGNGTYRLASYNGQEVALTGYVGVAKDVVNQQPQVTATFVAGGTSFSTFGTQANGAVFRSGIGLTFANSTKPLRVNLNYDLQAGNNAYSGVGELTVIYKL